MRLADELGKIQRDSVPYTHTSVAVALIEAFRLGKESAEREAIEHEKVVQRARTKG